MHVYFVRHGETELNLKRVHQSHATPLNEKGYEQARSVSEYLRPMNASLLISSTYERARQTARIIGFSTGITPQYNRLFCEVEWPSNLIERPFYGWRTFMYIGLSVFFRDSTTWRYKDGESFFEIYSRIQKSFRYIESLTEEYDSIIIVSHSEYMRLMIAYLCHGQKLTLREIVSALLSVNTLKNCEVLHVEYIGPTVKGTCAWLLRK